MSCDMLKLINGFQKALPFKYITVVPDYRFQIDIIMSNHCDFLSSQHSSKVHVYHKIYLGSTLPSKRNT